MSIETNNPVPPVEFLDAARNLLAQVRIAIAVGDIRHANQKIDQAEELLFKLQTQLEKSE